MIHKTTAMLMLFAIFVILSQSQQTEPPTTYCVGCGNGKIEFAEECDNINYANFNLFM